MTSIIKINPETPEPERIGEAVAILKAAASSAPDGDVLRLGADARNEAAIDKISA
jgi:tRNA A37 threonylcarbamoyladenosine synthetase subunit TsaC/SUA5/YrdC